MVHAHTDADRPKLDLAREQQSDADAGLEHISAPLSRVLLAILKSAPVRDLPALAALSSAAAVFLTFASLFGVR